MAACTMGFTKSNFLVTVATNALVAMQTELFTCVVFQIKLKYNCSKQWNFRNLSSSSITIVIVSKRKFSYLISRATLDLPLVQVTNVQNYPGCR